MSVTGYSTTTYKMKLFCKHIDWLIETKRLYNSVEEFYYNLFLEYPQLWELSCQNALRELERLTLTGKNGDLPKVKLPFENIPVYFRRSAINAALAIAHIYIANKKKYRQENTECLTENANFNKNIPSPAKSFNTSPIFYKHMYKDFNDNEITLKLWTGCEWVWVRCKYMGREMPSNAEKMSPTIVIQKKAAFLHIPVKVETSDARTVKERMEANGTICGINFTNYDAFAVCCIQTAEGKTLSSRFIRGGDAYVHQCKRLLERISANQKSMGNNFDWTDANKKYWKRLNNISEYWAHKISREIIVFCKENDVKTISIAKHSEDIIDYVVKKSTKYTPAYLSLRIRKYLDYKAWQEGIVITEVRANYTSSKCTICRSYIIKQASNVKTFRCKGGHSGNKDLNTAKNVGKMALKKFGKLSV